MGTAENKYYTKEDLIEAFGEEGANKLIDRLSPPVEDVEDVDYTWATREIATAEAQRAFAKILKNSQSAYYVIIANDDYEYDFYPHNTITEVKDRIGDIYLNGDSYGDSTLDIIIDVKNKKVLTHNIDITVTVEVS